MNHNKQGQTAAGGIMKSALAGMAIGAAAVVLSKKENRKKVQSKMTELLDMMKAQSFSEKKRNLMSSVASMSAQIELLKRKKEFESLDEGLKESIERLSERMTRL